MNGLSGATEGAAGLGTPDRQLRRFVALGPVTDFLRDVRERGVSLSESGAAPRAEVRPVLPDELREVWPG